MSGNKSNEYLNYLPALYRDRDNLFLGQFLALFETPLRDLEKKIGDIPAYFNPDSFAPQRVPALFGEAEARREFLGWLAGWVALSLRQDWSEDSQRLLIKKITTIYPIRGTRAGVEKLLRIYVDPNQAETELDEEGGVKQVLDTFDNLTLATVETRINNQSESLIEVRNLNSPAPGNRPLPTTIPLSTLVLSDRASNPKPTLQVIGLEQGLELEVADGTDRDTFKLTLMQNGASLPEFDNLTLENAEARVNNASRRYIRVINRHSDTPAPGNRPLPTTVPLALPSPAVLKDRASQPTLAVTVLKPGLALRVEDGTESGTFKLTVIAAEPYVSIQEQLFPFRVGIHSTVGEDTFVGGGMPHYFTVRIDFSVWKPDYQAFKQSTVKDIVDLEKPAHTYYDPEVLIPTLQVGVRSLVGTDTVLGNKNN